ncbi:MAG TPA: hypothetical protein VFC31_01370 [Candidatus Limnocylindria bacterium]|nr:hypothetical protein [Candidatus Limnocylindria bacterium]
MASYLLAYHGGKMPDSKEAQARVMAAWNEWMRALGAALIDGGNPVGKTSTIGSNGKVTSGGGANPVSGYSVIKAASLDDAVKLAQGCPVLQGGATIEVCETFEAM